MLDCDLAVAVLADRVEEEALDAALVQHDLLEARDVGDRVGDAVAALDDAVAVRVPQADLQHVVRFDPGAVAEVERVEDLERAALQAVGLAVEDLWSALVCVVFKVGGLDGVAKGARLD